MLATIIISIILLVFVFLVIKKLYEDRKRGASSCGCGCSGCPRAGLCQIKKDEIK